ncbi:MAG TPA: aminomethyl-transferring glycine dehydrogenase subunit GcvPA [Euryarchaeota archaeon]|nr:aminomethyl-transferring glycine dehydrogenase subunit GcvPA [Euryarchaeota archaeon]
MIDPEILKALGISSPEELFEDIPAEARISSLKLPEPMDERDFIRHFKKIVSKNITVSETPSFLGGGVYRHYIPAAVREILARSEFYTSYTPYQPEASQGMLQAMFEYQSYMSILTGMDIVNSSMYDWSTALGEAALMCHRIRRGSRFLIARSTSPVRKRVLEMYLRGIDASVEEIPFDPETSRLSVDSLEDKLKGEVFGFYLENPNLFGVMDENVFEVSDLLGEVPLVIGADPLSLAIMKPPSEYGADIVIGEGHHLGTDPNFGGPLLGIFGCRKEHLRKMPGRIIGATTDATGKRAFCMTLQTREQHIRRDKATSNICTNESLMALAACAYLAALGGTGFRGVALENLEKAKDLSGRISEIDGFRSPRFDAPHFNEFAVGCDIPVDRLRKRLLEGGIQIGPSLSKDFPEVGEAVVIAVSELHTEDELNKLISSLEGTA